MGSVVVPVTMLAGGAALIYVGVTNPAGGGFAGLANLIKGQPNIKASANTAAFAGTLSDLAAVGAGTPTTPGGAAGAVYTGAGLDAARSEVLAAAGTWLGVPYEFGGNTRHGIDCSGLTLQVYATAGVHLPRVSYLQAKRGRRVTNPQPGDLVCFGSPVDHVGIYLGNGQMINAPHPGTVVRVEPVDYGVHPITYRDVLSRKTRRRRTTTTKGTPT